MTLAENLYKTLRDSEIISKEGYTTFSLNGIDVEVSNVNIIGDLIQEWLRDFMIHNKIDFREKGNTQAFPDFLLNPESEKTDLLEVKSFTKSPNFDIANFSAYARSLRENAYRLDAKYLIFHYSPKGKGVVIDNIWLKNVWEICGNSNRSPLKIQWKQSDPVNIRPIVWYSNRAKYKPFQSRREFVVAFESVINMARIDSGIQKNWLEAVAQNYKDHTGRKL